MCYPLCVNPSRRVNWETFVVRIWREKVNAAWRGQIVHLSSRESSHFATLAQIEAFISRFAEGIEAQTSSKGKEETDAQSSTPTE